MARKVGTPFSVRVRHRRQEFGWTREDLAERIEGRLLSTSAIKGMEEMSEAKSYRLPQRIPSRFKRPGIELLADALDVPLGYLLAGFTDNEISNSIYRERVRSGTIRLMPELRTQQRSTSFADFLRGLPTNETELLGLPLHAYSNQFAFAVIFRIERLYCGLEMLMVNEPPLIFWDKEDIALWVENLKLSPEDAASFQAEFARYQDFFRGKAQKRLKRYKIVVNHATLKRFFDRKSAKAKSVVVADMEAFLRLPNVSMTLYRTSRPDSSFSGDYGIEAREAEVLCKQQIIPETLDHTISVQIVQTPPHLAPVSYLVSPTPKNFIMLQKEIAYIDQAFAISLDQYRADKGTVSSSLHVIDDKTLERHTIELLRAM